MYFYFLAQIKEFEPSNVLMLFEPYNVTESKKSQPINVYSAGEFGLDEVYLPPDESDEIEVKALTDSEKLVEKFMAYIAEESKVFYVN